jgi:hypothetical protein
MILEHDLHRPQDRGGLGLEPTQATGNLPKSRDPGTAEAKDGSEGGGVHGRRCRRSTLAPLATGFLRPWLGLDRRPWPWWVFFGAPGTWVVLVREVLGLAIRKRQ